MGLPYADSVPNAAGGFAESRRYDNLQVEIASEILGHIPGDKRDALIQVLEQDPRPHYHDDPERIYGIAFAGMNVKFKVAGKVLTVTGIDK